MLECISQERVRHGARLLQVAYAHAGVSKPHKRITLGIAPHKMKGPRAIARKHGAVNDDFIMPRCVMSVKLYHCRMINYL